MLTIGSGCALMFVGRWAFRVAAAVATLVTLVSCSTSANTGVERTDHRPSAGRSSPVSADTAEPGTCATRPLRHDGAPAWASGPEHGFEGSNGTIYARSRRGRVVAYLFGHPLAVRDLGSKQDKILWFVREPDGPLTIQGRRVGSPQATFLETVQPAGEAGFPSYVHVSAAGCWHFTLSWGSGKSIQTDTIDLQYLQHR